MLLTETLKNRKIIDLKNNTTHFMVFIESYLYIFLTCFFNYRNIFGIDSAFNYGGSGRAVFKSGANDLVKRSKEG